jgi:hypothetical protein
VPSVVDRREHFMRPATNDDQRRREVSASEDVVETALASAVEVEIAERLPGSEGRVALLAGELQARRLARAGVTNLDTKRRLREP